MLTYVDSNRFTCGRKAPCVTLRRADQLTMYLAAQLNVDRPDLCNNIGLYWRQPQIRELQPHNLVGHAFRSLIVDVLQLFGDAEVSYEERVDRNSLFPGQDRTIPTKRSKLDIVARRRDRIVAILTVRWRIRHNRLQVFDEAFAYAPAISVTIRTANSMPCSANSTAAGCGRCWIVVLPNIRVPRFRPPFTLRHSSFVKDCSRTARSSISAALNG